MQAYILLEAITVNFIRCNTNEIQSFNIKTSFQTSKAVEVCYH